MKFELLVARLCKIIGEESAKLDDDKHIAFSMGDVVLHLQDYSEMDTFLAYADIGELPSSGVQLFMEQVLKANWIFQGTDGASLSINKNNGKLAISQYWTNSSMTQDEFINVLNRFLQVVQNWRDILEQYRLSGPALRSPEKNKVRRSDEGSAYL